MTYQTDAATVGAKADVEVASLRNQLAALKVRVTQLEAARATTTLTAVAGDGTATVKWTAVPGATGYKVTCGTWTVTSAATATSQIIPGLSNGVEQTISVQPLPVGVTKTVKVTPKARITPAAAPPGYGSGYSGTY
jgi:hypothetical protein